jgi:hypothetical protein
MKITTDTPNTVIVMCIARLRNRTLTNREKNCRQGRFAAETRQSRGRQRMFVAKVYTTFCVQPRKFVIIK